MQPMGTRTKMTRWSSEAPHGTRSKETRLELEPVMGPETMTRSRIWTRSGVSTWRGDGGLDVWNRSELEVDVDEMVGSHSGMSFTWSCLVGV